MIILKEMNTKSRGKRARVGRCTEVLCLVKVVVHYNNKFNLCMKASVRVMTSQNVNTKEKLYSLQDFIKVEHFVDFPTN